VRRTRTGRRNLRGAAACLLVALAAGCAASVDDVAAPAPAPTPATSSAPSPAVEPLARQDKTAPIFARRPRVDRKPLPAGSPERVVIDAIGVDAQLVELGLQPDGEMEVPAFGLAGWYREGPPPGHAGPAVIAAHVDSRAGPDVFFRLRELMTDDRVEVHFDSGATVIFRVVSSERVPKDELPGDRIWPVTVDPLLTLITCGGEFDRSARSYRDNVLVYTVPEDAAE
jgi:hypothetical protein